MLREELLEKQTALCMDKPVGWFVRGVQIVSATRQMRSVGKTAGSRHAVDPILHAVVLALFVPLRVKPVFVAFGAAAVVLTLNLVNKILYVFVFLVLT